MYDVYIPKSVELKKYISEFTILKKEGFEPMNYFAFPHYVGAIAFYNYAEIRIEKSEVILTNSESESSPILVVGKYLKPLHLVYEKAVDEIGINFTPTGMNYFFDIHVEGLANKPVQFLENQLWSEFSKKLFKTNVEDKIQLLEEFLLSQIRNKDLKKIESILEIIKADLTLKVKDVAQEVRLSERTINRLFHTYIGCSPVAFKKILRFRSSVIMNDKQMSLTELCLNNEYYDSPHFTNEFKQLTSINPKNFFNDLTKVGDKGFPYIFK